MNFLILGNGPEEEQWAQEVNAAERHEVLAVFPGIEGLPTPSQPEDFEAALALAGIEAVIVGGEKEVRTEWLRRVAATGLPAICLHPPGDDSEGYYQVALSRHETGSVLVPDLPARLHPGLEALQRAIQGEDFGHFRALIQVSSGWDDLVHDHFSKRIDVIRALLGEVESLTGLGDPPGPDPDLSLVVQLRGSNARRAEVRITSGQEEWERLTIQGSKGSLTLEYRPNAYSESRLIRQVDGEAKVTTDLPTWSPHQTLLSVLDQAIHSHEEVGPHPDLFDGTRAMEVTEAVARSLRRGRTVDLHYEVISEASNFKSVMTSAGCMLLLGILFVLPIALAGPALGMNWTLYLAYAILPILILFALLQFLRFAANDQSPPPPNDAP